MVNKFLIKVKPYTLAHQKIDLCKRFPGGEAHITRGLLFWKAKVKPTPLSREYNIEMYYQIKKLPKIYIVGDGLSKLDDPNFPHHYCIDQDNKRVEICLFRYDFSSDMLLSKTVVPWAIEWLYYYEIWLYTGVWNGGGEHPKT